MSRSSGSNLKRIYWVFVVVAVLLVLYQVSRNSHILQPDERLQELQPAPVAQLSLDPDALVNAEAALQQAQDALIGQAAMQAKATTSDTGTVLDTSTATNAWQADPQVSPAIPLPDAVVDYEPVSVDMDSPAYPGVGEQVKLMLPGGSELVAKVASSHENPNGDYSWRGYLEGHGDEYPVVMTYGGNSVFATITTPQGSYTLESVNGSGWVYKNPSEFELSEPGKNDYLEIPHAHDHE
ncbi:hypothetical protein [Cellvibrio sp. pealriver]|uniref:hypothetical protein n=1 Tax=Cellvibrio sp. pealriver TaxID=1622269 RepID=UPI00066FE1CC|nr:hypothetical protein [Cellvibrio sp. pealriver]